jgi:hypothetical protein
MKPERNRARCLKCAGSTFRLFPFPLLCLVDESHVIFAGHVPALVGLVQLAKPSRVGSVTAASANDYARKGS